MTAMSKGELSSFLNRGTFMAKLPIVKEDGSPRVVPLWFVLDAEDNIIFGTATNSVKWKNISCDPRVSKYLRRPPRISIFICYNIW
jgi:uncharacterized pyridoxamine 5'-phosphate oxidase family protein